MAYTIQKAAHIQDELTIKDDSGRDDLTLHINIYIDDILQDIDAVRARLGAAQQAVAELKAGGAAGREPGEIKAAHDALKSAAEDLFRLIFGDGPTDDLIRYYDGRIASALGDLLPYITQVILPEIRKAQAELAERYAAWNR